MRVRIFIVILLAFTLGACSIGGGPAPTPAPSPTSVPAATAVPTPETPLAILVLPADMDKATSDTAQTIVYDLAQASGLRFQVRNTFSEADLVPGLRILIALPPDPGIATLAAAAPGVQFLAINIPDVAAGGNVSVLAGNSQVDVPAFLAGYAAAVISDDFRGGMILPKDDALGRQAAQAFANGMAYHCGMCTSYRLYMDSSGVGLRFPQFIEIPSDEDPSRLGGWANYAVGDLKLDAVYVFPSPVTSMRQLYDSLGQTGAKILGNTPPNPRPAGWVMSIQADAVKAIQAAWPELLAGRGGQSIPSPLGLADVDPAYLSPGRQRLVQQVLDDLQAGRISTGVGQ